METIKRRIGIVQTSNRERTMKRKNLSGPIATKYKKFRKEESTWGTKEFLVQ